MIRVKIYAKAQDATPGSVVSNGVQTWSFGTGVSL